MAAGKVVKVSVSEKKGVKKNNVPFAELKENFGILGDAHAGSDKQVSLLAAESIEKMRRKGLCVNPGDFAENITTEGVDLLKLKTGIRLNVGEEAVLEITQVGKVCHLRCKIYEQAGDCVMPREGVFGKVIKGGIVKPDDRVVLIGD